LQIIWQVKPDWKLFSCLKTDLTSEKGQRSKVKGQNKSQIRLKVILKLWANYFLPWIFFCQIIIEKKTIVSSTLSFSIHHILVYTLSISYFPLNIKFDIKWKINYKKYILKFNYYADAKWFFLDFNKPELINFLRIVLLTIPKMLWIYDFCQLSRFYDQG
jgi:hypothetical protein